MKPIFSPEAVQELGYQKYWPELHDWIFGTAICLVAGIIFMGSLVGIIYLFK